MVHIPSRLRAYDMIRQHRQQWLTEYESGIVYVDGSSGNIQHFANYDAMHQAFPHTTSAASTQYSGGGYRVFNVDLERLAASKEAAKSSSVADSNLTDTLKYIGQLVSQAKHS